MIKVKVCVCVPCELTPVKVTVRLPVPPVACPLIVPLSLRVNPLGNVVDVIVIGAGVEGSATAYQLTKLAKEKRVALVEQFDAHHSRGSSHGGSRITRKAYPEEFYAAMMQEAYPLWEQLERESGRKIYIHRSIRLQLLSRRILCTGILQSITLDVHQSKSL